MQLFGQEIDTGRLPRHVGIIMDGNGRWAQSRLLPRVAGHERGYRVLKEIIEANRSIGIPFISVYAFSTENWTRPQKEVNFLMDLADRLVSEYFETLLKNDIRLTVTGVPDNVPESLITRLNDAAVKTAHCKSYTLNIVFNYGGRREILDAAKRIAWEAVRNPSMLESLTEESFRNYLYQPDIPDVDLMIRTSGEERISNFLLWQISYSELYFTKVLWPDFTPEEFALAIAGFQTRQRRFGSV